MTKNKQFGENLTIGKYFQNARWTPHAAPETGADVNAQTNEGNTTLLYAAEHADWELVKWLVEHGADINTKMDHGNTVLHCATCTKTHKMAQMFDLIFQDNLSDMVQSMKKRKGQVGFIRIREDIDEEENALLSSSKPHSESVKGELELVQWLVDHGADLHAQNDEGKTVLHSAAEGGGSKLIQWLAEQGLDLNAKTFDGSTVLHYAAQSGNLELVQWLVEKGLDINAKDQWGRTVLHRAAQGGSVETVQWLTEHGADISAKTLDGRTVMDFALENQIPSLIAWLKNNGAK